MKNEKNENVPDIEQGQHERLCAYVFGELQGAERAAFEAELLRSPELRRERERLAATIGLVKRVIPDEGLSSEVRRDLLASARRSRFRFLSGRKLVSLAAAAVVLVGGALALYRVNSGASRLRQNVRDSKVAQSVLIEGDLARERTMKARERVVADATEGLQELGHASGQSAAPASSAPSTEALLKGLGYVGEAEGTELSFGVTSGEPVLEARLASLARGEQESLGVVPAPSGPISPGTDGFFLGARGKSADRSALRMGRVELAKEVTGVAYSYAGPGDTKPPLDGDPGAAMRSLLVAPASPAAQPGENREVADRLEGLRAIGYVEDGTLARLEELGYGGEAEERRKDEDSRRSQREPVRSREEVTRQVEGLLDQALDACRVAPGESPRAMFFRYFGDSPFLLAAEEKSSTFAVDVDTASYALTRAYLNRGELPPREAVRTEEFVNYFKADQPAPMDGKPFAIGLELAPSLFAGDARAEMLRVTVRGKDVADFERQPLALTFVIDNSGSMQEGGRLELVKRALALLLRQLYASDSVAIVKFSNSAALVTPMIPAARRGELEGLLQALPIEGGTNVEAGLRLGYEQALQSLARNAVNRVILCSDGVGNIGETSAKGLLELVRDARAKGIYLNTVGVGMRNHDDAFLEELADKGDGVCHYVDSDAEAKRVFVDGLASALQPIARDVKIQVEFDPAQVESWRLLGYENRALREQDFKNDRIDAGEVNAGHQVTALYELVRRPSRSGPLATVRLRYKPPFAIDQGKEGEGARAEAEQALELERTVTGSAVLPGFASASSGYQRAVLVAQFAEVLRQSVHARKDSFATLLSESRRLERAFGDPDFTEFVALLEKANALLDARSKQETPRVQLLLDELSQLRYEQALRERQAELAAQAGEPEKSADEMLDAERVEREAKEAIQRLESEVRAELFRTSGIEQPTPEEREHLRGLGYAR